MEEEIRIYRSVWKNVLLVLCCLALTAVSVLILFAENKKPGLDIVAWIGIPLYFLGGLIIAYKVLKERLSHTPFLVITDKKVVMNNNGTSEISFADVDAFFLTQMQIRRAVEDITFIGIRYKEDIELQRWNNAKQVGRIVRKYNIQKVGAQEIIPTVGLAIKPQALCDLLNGRLAEFNRCKGMGL